MKNLNLLALVMAASSALAAETSAPADSPKAGDAGYSEKALHCVDLVRIQNSEVIDDRHMLFEVSGGKMYLNTLPYACPGLHSNDPWMMRSSQDRLCDLDIITVLHTAGVGFIPGPSCGLGMFEPVTQSQVDMVKQAAKAKRTAKPKDAN